MDNEQHGLFGGIHSVSAISFDAAFGSAVFHTNLTIGLAGISPNQDANLINPWGLVASTAGPFWASDNGASVSTLYDCQGQPQLAGSPPIVSISLPDGTPGGSPTGVEFNGGRRFHVFGHGACGRVADGEKRMGAVNTKIAAGDGALLGGENKDGRAAGADHAGPAKGTVSNGPAHLYAVHLGRDTVEVVDAAFLPTLTIGGSFTDSQVPAAANTLAKPSPQAFSPSIF
jgi:hypothetical protein